MMHSLGQKLQQARKEQRLTLEKASEATHIRVPYLRALEADDLSVLPSPVQARGFLRNYAEFLGLDFNQLIEEVRTGQQSADEIIGPADAPPSPTPQFQAATPLPQPEPVSAPQPEPGLEPAPEKPKRRGRPNTEPAPEKTKRRGRKKEEPALESPAEIQPPQINPERVNQVETLNELGPVLETPVALPQEESQQSGLNDNLWQSWLNRLGSLISSRTKPIQSGGKPSETENSNSIASPSEDESSQNENLLSEEDMSESSQIFKEIGEALHSRRELLSLHLEEVERNTHVKAHYLEALEAGAMEDLPSTVQTRGMLSNYATFLDLDVDALLLRYADALQARHREKNPQKTTRTPGQPIIGRLPPLRSFIAGDMIFGIGMAVLLIGFSIWGINQIMQIQSQQEVEPTGPSISDVLLASPDPASVIPTATSQPFPVISQPTATIEIPTQNLNVNVQVNLVAVERTYMRVVVDGEEVFNGRTMPGTAYPFEAEEQVEILVGSGAAIRIVYNGRDLGLLGGLGQVVDNIYRADEIITPTAQPSPTPTNTVPVTATLPPATLTPVPTITIAP